MVEVDGLPGVEQDRAGAGGVGGQSAQVRVGAGAQGVEALAPGTDDPWGGIGVARGQDDLAGVEELAGS